MSGAAPAIPVVARTMAVPMSLAGLRLDAALAALLPEHSRSRLKAWLEDGHVLVDGETRAGKTRLEGGELLSLTLPDAGIEIEAQAEDIPLDILHEDEHLLVLDKPPGLVVHPGAGNREGTLLNALLHHAPSLANVARAGIVHRLDKDTSGVMMVAKTPLAQTQLVRQLQSHSASREYVALVHGEVRRNGTVEGAIGRSARDRTKMAMVVTGGKSAVTHYKVREHFGGPALKGRHYTLIECKLETGRTHQIRVHMASIKHPLVGDATYGKRGDVLFHRQALHAWRLTLAHPLTGEMMRFSAPIPRDMKFLLRDLRAERDNATRTGDDSDDDLGDEGDVEVIYVRE
ncbi:MAG: RluA family pseudouridine synthase [Burkholderiales bacterium]|nr:RluA family pseudouridine synthase [Burkholderiales bacterium]